MATLPVRPNLDHLRRQARDLLRAARAGDSAAVGRLTAVSGAQTLAGAQLAIAREYGFASWARLKREVDARTMELAELADAFCQASIRDGSGRALRMLAAHPHIAGYNLATAVILGDADRVRDEIRRDPSSATRPDDRWQWTPLHAVCASRWHRLDPRRAPGMLTVARLLLAAGADPNAEAGGRPDSSGGWTPLRCAVAGAANSAIAGLLLDHGAVPTDHDVYLACFADDDHECLRLLLDRRPNLAGSTALAAPISIADVTGVRLLLRAGVDPNRASPAQLYGVQHRDDPALPAVYAAVRCGCPTELVRLLLDHGADPNVAGPDGESPYRLAIRHGSADVAALLRRRGAVDDTTDTDRLLASCLGGDRVGARRLLAGRPGLLDRLTDADRGVMVRAAEAGRTGAVRLMLELGFPVDTRGGDAGGTALHAAAYAGSAEAIQLLVEAGADVQARDLTWASTPLEWALVGSGERPTLNPDPDWLTGVRILIHAGAGTERITLSPDGLKAPSQQVAELLREHGIGDEPAGDS